MNKKLAFLFPGQGAQYVDMGKDFYDAYDIAKQTFEEASDLLNENYTKLIFEGPQEVLTLTKHSQVAIFIVSMALLRVIRKEFSGLKPSVCAGLSLGEYTALCASEKISFKDCLYIVKDRAQFMNDACEAKAGTMRVVLGMTEEEIASAIKECIQAKVVWIANLNCPGQVVISGTVQGVEQATELLKAAGAKRVLPLDVSGAFHSGLMMPAQERLEPKLKSVEIKTSSIDLVMNVPGDYVSSVEDIRSNLIQQVTSSVRWEKGIRHMMAKGVDTFIEIGCGKTLAGMNKKIGIEAPTLSVEKIQDLEQLSKVGNS